MPIIFVKSSVKRTASGCTFAVMQFDYVHLLPAEFEAGSRVWLYQSNRLFSLSEALQLEDILTGFSESWQSHGRKVKAYANLLFGRFIVLMADETATGVSGCSTDSSVRLVKEIETLFKVNFFDRQLLAFVVKEKVEMLPLSQLPYAIENGFIGPDTIYFNNLVSTKKELEESWMISIRESWLAARYVKAPAPGGNN
jgi:hypothetical protein